MQSSEVNKQMKAKSVMPQLQETTNLLEKRD